MNYSFIFQRIFFGKLYWKIDKKRLFKKNPFFKTNIFQLLFQNYFFKHNFQLILRILYVVPLKSITIWTPHIASVLLQSHNVSSFANRIKTRVINHMYPFTRTNLPCETNGHVSLLSVDRLKGYTGSTVLSHRFISW